jgi:hypothetical protein
MSIQRLFLAGFLLASSLESFSQNFILTEPKLEFDGRKLAITYDLITKSKSDIFSVWVEIRDKDGDPIRAFSFKGEIGDSVKAGSKKVVTWVPEDDAVFLDEDISVELKGERFEKTFNKGSMVLYSVILPGLGQTKIRNKPWWLASVAGYGSLAGGLIFNKKYSDTYDLYLKSTEASERADLLTESQRNKNISSAFFITSAVIWISDIIWVAATPDRYKPLRHASLSFKTLPVNNDRFNYVCLKVNF